MLNLKNILISTSEAKQEIARIVSNKLTRIIVRHNEPVSVIMPYDDYVRIADGVKETTETKNVQGTVITLSNGVTVMGGLAYDEDNNMLKLKLYKKMTTSGCYVLHHTLHISAPSLESTYTTLELVERLNNDNVLD